MPDPVIESAPGSAPVIAPTAQDREVIAAQQDAAWDDDKTDTGATEGSPAADAAPDAEVITDKPALAGAVPPPPKPGAKPAEALPAGEPAAGADGKPVKAEEAAPGADAPLSVEEKSKAYWDKVGATFPGAQDASQTPKFAAWFHGLTDAEKAAAADLDKPDDAVRLMARYYEDLAAGKVKDPEPPGPAPAFDLSSHIAGRNLADVKVKMSDGTETTLGEMSKPEQYGDIIAAMGALTQASENAVMARINDLVNQGVLVTGRAFNQLLERLGEKDLTAKVPDAPSITSDPKFQSFRDASPLLKRGWATGDADTRAEIISMFRAEQAKGIVAGAAAGQRRTTQAKADLHRGSLRGGAPGSGKPADDAATVAEAQDRAWDTPIEVEGAKV